MTLAVALVLLAVVLAAAVVRPHGAPEAAVAVPAALLAVGLNLITPGAAAEELQELGPTVGFLAAILLLGQLAAAEGVFV